MKSELNFNIRKIFNQRSYKGFIFYLSGIFISLQTLAARMKRKTNETYLKSINSLKSKEHCTLILYIKLRQNVSLQVPPESGGDWAASLNFEMGTFFVITGMNFYEKIRYSDLQFIFLSLVAL